VAEKAGVSIATVSKVINNTGNMRESTRGKVKKVMEQLNYQPNIMASALMGKGTKTIGLLINDISNPIFSELSRIIEDRSHEKGYSVIICNTDDDVEKELKYLEVLHNKRVDGLIVGSSFKDKSKLNEMINLNVPLVILTHMDEEVNASKVAVDDYKGGFIATEHLLENGHRSIAIIAELADSSSKRIKGYLGALESWGINHDPMLMKRISASVENGMNQFLELYKEHVENPPTAVFTSNDQIAIGVLLAAKKLNLSIPTDLSVIGFDDTILAKTAQPSLSTVAQPIAGMGKEVVDMLIDEIETGDRSVKKIIHDPTLIIRETTKVTSNQPCINSDP